MAEIKFENVSKSFGKTHGHESILLCPNQQYNSISVFPVFPNQA